MRYSGRGSRRERRVEILDVRDEALHAAKARPALRALLWAADPTACYCGLPRCVTPTPRLSVMGQLLSGCCLLAATRRHF
jgi:hypothetical protein